MQSQPRSPAELFQTFVGRAHFADLLSATTLSQAQFLSQFVPVAEQLAWCVQDLPLRPDVFKGPGGALQAGLQSGLLAVRSCDSTIFEPRATAEERQRNDPQYRWLAYCAALASVYLMCAGQLHVSCSGARYSFACGRPLGRLASPFEAAWQESASGVMAAGLVYLQAFFHPGQFSHLEPSLLSLLGGAINPALSASAQETPLGRVVRTSITQVLERQRARDAAIIEPVPAARYEDAPASGPVAVQTPSAAAAASQPSSASPSSAPATPSAGSTDSEAIRSMPCKPTTGLESQQTAHGTSGATATQSAAGGIARQPLPGPVADWVRALAHLRSMDAEVAIEGERIRFSRKALGFGASPRENYTALYEAGVVHEKGTDFAWCTQPVRDAYLAEKPAPT